MKNFIYRAKYKFANRLPLLKPVDVLMELSSQCNQKCKYCYHSAEKLPFNRGIMQLETAKRIIESSADCGVNSMKFNWRGESTINPDFYSILKYAHDCASGMTLMDRITNSNFIFPKGRKDEILDALCFQTKVKVSFDTFDPDIFAQQRGSQRDWANAFANISEFYRHPKRKNTELVIQAVRTNLNKNEDIESKIKSAWPEVSVSIRDMVEGRVDNENDLADKKRDFSERKPCLQAFARIIFDYLGRAFPCCPDIENKLYLGDINNQSIAEIWSSKRFKNLRKSLKNKTAFDYDPCKSCSSFETFKGYKHGWQS